MELLVAITITIILLLSLSYAVTNVSETWSRSKQDVEKLKEGRVALSEITADILRAVSETIHPSVGYSGTPGKSTTQFIENPPLPAPDPRLAITDSIFFEAAGSLTPSGNLELVGYFVNAEHTLVRFDVAADNANQATYTNGPNNAYLVPNYLPDPTVPWLNQSPFVSSYFAPDQGGGYNSYGIPIKASSIASALCRNVVGFWIRCLDRNGNDIAFAQVSQPPSKFDSSFLGTMGRLPSNVEITIAVLDDASVKRLPQGFLTSVHQTAITNPSNATFQASVDSVLNSFMSKSLPVPKVFDTIVSLPQGTY